jgi:uncharacterized membrane protein
LEDVELLDALDYYVGVVLKAIQMENEMELEKNVFLTKESFQIYYKVWHNIYSRSCLMKSI